MKTGLGLQAVVQSPAAAHLSGFFFLSPDESTVAAMFSGALGSTMQAMEDSGTPPETRYTRVSPDSSEKKEPLYRTCNLPVPSLPMRLAPHMCKGTHKMYGKSWTHILRVSSAQRLDQKLGGKWNCPHTPSATGGRSTSTVAGTIIRCRCGRGCAGDTR